MGEKENIFQDIDKMKQVSEMMQSDGKSDTDFFKMVDTVKQIQSIMNFMQDKDADSNSNPTLEAEEKKEEEALPFSTSRQEHMIHAAIPFLDQEYQKNIYIMVRFMEMKRVMGQGGVLMESRSKKTEDSKVRQKKLLHAIRPYLTQNEKKQMDFMIKAMNMKTIIEGQEENNEK